MKAVLTYHSHSYLYSIMVEDGIQDVFPNVDIALRIFLTLMITNCTAERSFSQLKKIKCPARNAMTQNRLEALSLLCIESDMLRQIQFTDLIDQFATQKSRKKLIK